MKISGIAWFDRMKAGVADFAKKTGINASQIGPTTASPELEANLLRSAITQNPTVLAVIPIDPASVETALAQARSKGITVVTHEAPTITNADADIEAFDNASYGEQIMSSLAKCMNGSGDYAQFVGSLTSETHMDWANAGLAMQEKKYPGMHRIAQPFESNDNAATSYTKTKQILQSNPGIKGFFGDSSQDVPGIARAIQEAGLQDKICVFGTGVPSETKQYIADGSADGIFLWDPKLAGEAMLQAGKILASGKKLSAGVDLKVPGYTSMHQSATNPLEFYGDAILSITKANIDNYTF
ncbi:substrate-binding domain-containing protein [Galbitalea soli]|uniref:Autoinducer 2 ABC transporter substrate-binding protein n=1 Tax=Galbitalea soli TaxID=1268042 RepID=A0A7C9TQH5_9MICO|nr:autoinducer 2 ABC transporter substrate-binding protein [Galbitalea soli]NYJ31458.1 simple sugar transport system substrate-binding protein [Galbitalea soli]